MLRGGAAFFYVFTFGALFSCGCSCFCRWVLLIDSLLFSFHAGTVCSPRGIEGAGVLCGDGVQGALPAEEERPPCHPG